jgi:hypothetical protein
MEGDPMDYLLAGAVGIALAALCLLFLIRHRIQLDSHQAMLIFRRGQKVQLALQDRTVLPLLEDVELIDLSAIQLKWSFKSLQCQDLFRADVDIHSELLFAREPRLLLRLLGDTTASQLQSPDFWQARLEPILKETLQQHLQTRDTSFWARNPKELSQHLETSIHPWEGIRFRSFHIPSFAEVDETRYSEDDPSDRIAIIKLRRSRFDMEQLEQDVERAERTIEASKVLQKQLVERQRRIQNLRNELETGQSQLEKDVEQLSVQIRKRLDKVRGELDERIGTVHAASIRTAAAKGMTLPQGVEEEITRVHSRKRSELNLIQAENEKNVVSLRSKMDRIFRG